MVGIAYAIKSSSSLIIVLSFALKRFAQTAPDIPPMTDKHPVSTKCYDDTKVASSLVEVGAPYKGADSQEGEVDRKEEESKGHGPRGLVRGEEHDKAKDGPDDELNDMRDVKRDPLGGS